MRIVMQLSGRGMALYTRALEWLKTQLCKLVSNLRVSFTQAFQNVVSLLSRLVKTLLSFKVLLANLTIAAQSIKAALKRAVTTNGQTGSQPQTTVRQTRRRVSKRSKKGS
jgi:hypothetical protein